MKILIGAAALVTVLGVLETIESVGRGHMPFSMDGQHRVTAVQSDADLAGVKVGDVLTHIDTVDVNARQSFLASPPAGATRTYTFTREGVPFRADIRHLGPGGHARVLTILATLAGIIFLAFPLWAASRSRAALPLAVGGLGCAAAILGAPEAGSNAAALVVFNARWLAAIVGVTGFLHFLVIFPTPLRWFARPRTRALLYLPALVVVLEYAISALATDSWAGVIGATWFASLLLLSLGCVVALSSRLRRAEDGNARRMAATTVALVAFAALYAALRAFVPPIGAAHVLPPADYFALFAMTAVPIVFARRLTRTAAR